jgi:hypothetical protein
LFDGLHVQLASQRTTFSGLSSSRSSKSAAVRPHAVSYYFLAAASRPQRQNAPPHPLVFGGVPARVPGLYIAPWLSTCKLMSSAMKSYPRATSPSLPFYSVAPPSSTPKVPFWYSRQRCQASLRACEASSVRPSAPSCTLSFRFSFVRNNLV